MTDATADAAGHAASASTESTSPFTVAVRCPNLFHDEVEGGESIIPTDRTVRDRAELEAIVARGVEIHARCYCGRSTTVTKANALFIAPG